MCLIMALHLLMFLAQLQLQKQYFIQPDVTSAIRGFKGTDMLAPSFLGCDISLPQSRNVLYAQISTLVARVLGRDLSTFRRPSLMSMYSITQEQHPGHSFIKLSKTDDYIVSRHSVQYQSLADLASSNVILVIFRSMGPLVTVIAFQSFLYFSPL
jgi:hypothetical protein